MRWNATQVTAAAAVVTAIAAVVLTVWDNVQQRDFYRVSVLPLVNYTLHKEGTAEGAVRLANEGVGPARITEVRIGFCDGDSTYPSWNEARDAFRERGLTLVEYRDLREGDVLGTGRETSFVRFRSAGDGDAEFDRIQAAIDDLAFDIRYASVYGEEFHVSRRPECVQSGPG